MSERILFLTGRLAEKSLRRVLQRIPDPSFSSEVLVLSLQVAGLMTAEMIARRLPTPVSADRILVPGRCRGDLAALSHQLGVPVVRGPDDLKDLPAFFGREQAPRDLSRHDVRIFAEIVDAPNMSVEAICEQAARYREAGADVIDLGCLPETPFPQLEEAVMTLRASGFAVSIDSMNPAELLRGGRAGAEYLLSLKLETLAVAEQVGSVPVLIPSSPGDMASLYRAIDAMSGSGRPFLVDPILDPIHVGFVESLLRYRELRKQRPDVAIMMGTGNVTELTDADTAGMQALLAGVVSELGITHILTTQVSPHCAGVVREADAARKLMFAAREEDALPRGYGELLLALRSLDPFPYTAGEIAAIADEVRDPSFRIQISPDGLHVYNRDGVRTASDPFKLLPMLGVEDDASHAFYLGVELARAQIAWQLGKRYVQDQELDWGPAQLRKTGPEPAQWATGLKTRPRRGAN